MWDLLVVWAQALKQGIDTYLDPLGIVLGLVLAFPIFGTWWEVTVGRRRREQRWFREIRRKPGERPAILILDLLPGRSVRPAFEQFLQADAGLKEISGDRVFVIARDANLTPEELTALRRALRDTAARIYANGTDTLHYFHAGPTFVAALVGAEFANGCRDML